MPQANFESIRKAKEKGIAVYLTGFFLLLLIPVVGLSIDAGYAFVIQERVSAAADSAALAAGRGINLNGTQSAANAQATTQATNFFNSDFPSGYMNTSTSNRTVTPTFTVNMSNGTPTGILTISITASVVAPTYFMRWLGINTLTIAATGTATRKNLAMELVVDTSASMGTRSGSQVGHIPSTLAATDTSCQAMVYASALFITYFSPYDTIGLISFDLTVTDQYAASENYWESGSSGMDAKLENLNCGSNTNTTAALYKAYQDIKAIGEPLAQNVIVLFTDGVPNAVNATFNVRTQVDTRYSPSQQACTTANGFTSTQVTAGCSNTCIDGGGQINCTSSIGGSTACPVAGNAALGCKAGLLTAGGSSPGGMPVCTTTAGTISVAISQTDGFSIWGGSRAVDKMFSTDTLPSAPSGCTGPSGDGTTFTSQTLAYIPNSDYFTNSFINVKTGTSSTASSPWLQWIYGDMLNPPNDEINYTCAPSSVIITSGNTSCKNMGDFWTNHTAKGAGADTNTFTSGPYSGNLRPDTPNSIGTASMTSATNEAFTIRADTTYNPIIDVVYLQGNGTDPVDRSFLQLVSNQQYIQPLVYQSDPSCPNGSLANVASSATCITSGTSLPLGTFTNPYFQSSQQEGLWEQTADTQQLVTMFEAIASSLLRISQ